MGFIDEVQKLPESNKTLLEIMKVHNKEVPL